jgi:hypothetical protein
MAARDVRSLRGLLVQARAKRRTIAATLVRCQSLGDPAKREATSERVRAVLAKQDALVSDMERDIGRQHALRETSFRLRSIDRQIDLCFFHLAMPGRRGRSERRCAPRRRAGSAARCRSPGRLDDDPDPDSEQLGLAPGGLA